MLFAIKWCIQLLTSLNCSWPLSVQYLCIAPCISPGVVFMFFKHLALSWSLHFHVSVNIKFAKTWTLFSNNVSVNMSDTKKLVSSGLQACQAEYQEITEELTERKRKGLWLILTSSCNICVNINFSCLSCMIVRVRVVFRKSVLLLVTDISTTCLISSYLQSQVKSQLLYQILHCLSIKFCTHCLKL